MSTPSLEDLMCLTVGDVVEVPGLMTGLAPEQTLMQVVGVYPDAIVFMLSYFGVFIENRKLYRTKEGLVWTSK